jgi:hypothetical protein
MFTEWHLISSISQVLFVEKRQIVKDRVLKVVYANTNGIGAILGGELVERCYFTVNTELSGQVFGFRCLRLCNYDCFCFFV